MQIFVLYFSILFTELASIAIVSIKITQAQGLWGIKHTAIIPSTAKATRNKYGQRPQGDRGAQTDFRKNSSVPAAGTVGLG